MQSIKWRFRALFDGERTLEYAPCSLGSEVQKSDKAQITQMSNSADTTLWVDWHEAKTFGVSAGRDIGLAIGTAANERAHHDNDAGEVSEVVVATLPAQHRSYGRRTS